MKDLKSLKIYPTPIHHLFELFIFPEIEKRKKRGKNYLPLSAFQILFYYDGRRPEIRLNTEVKGQFQAKIKNGIKKQFGDSIKEDEIEKLTPIELAPEDDPDCGHATALRFNTFWYIDFDLRYNKKLASEYMKCAKEFLDCADFCRKNSQWRAFVDNLFSAAELFTKVILLAFGNPQLRKKATHKGIQIQLHKLFKFTSMDEKMKKSFLCLSGLREQARYLKGEFSITQENADDYYQVIEKLQEEALKVIKVRTEVLELSGEK
ncbi:hypothetical protein ACFL35_03920 [Candidatus Riflebacteria bacterium]